MTEEEAAFEEFLDSERIRLEAELRANMDFHEELLNEIMTNNNVGRERANAVVALMCLRDIAKTKGKDLAIRVAETLARALSSEVSQR